MREKNSAVTNHKRRNHAPRATNHVIRSTYHDKVPTPVAGCSHPYKYRLFYGFPGERIIGYDNERPKGDHRHQGKTQTHYRFESPEQLIDDFLRDVESRRK